MAWVALGVLVFLCFGKPIARTLKDIWDIFWFR